MTRFGICGTGRISDWILKGAMQEPRFKATAVCSRSLENARKFVDRHPEAFTADAEVFDSYDDFVKSDAIDAVYIGTPNSTHCDYAVRALEAGKHVLCEKPLACSAEEVRKMIDAARANRRMLMEAMVSTLNPNFRAARELISKIGKVRHYNSSFCQYSSKYEDLKQGRVASSFNPQLGGGALSDVGIYTTYPATALFGKPLRIQSNLIKYATEFGTTDIHGTIELRYDEMTAVLSFSKIIDSHTPTEICGEDGNIRMDGIHICRQLSFAPHQAPSSGRGPAASYQIINEGLEKDEYFYEFEEFINVLEAGKLESEINSLEVSLINREIMDTVLSQ